MEIIPAVIPKKFSDIEEKAEIVKDFLSTIQIDICDGGFVRNRTWPFENDYGEFVQIKNEERGLPFWEDLDYEIHLMTRTPEDEVMDWARAGAFRIFVHLEPARDSILGILNEWGNVVEIGIAINMNTSVKDLTPYFERVNSIQLMSIDHIGFQGEKFDENVFEKVKELRKLGFHKRISIDGGVDLDNVKILKDLGVDAVVVGSKIWENESPQSSIEDFKYI
jgi:ribulose-phosphate 3-epimerase